MQKNKGKEKKIEKKKKKISKNHKTETEKL